MAEAVLFGIFGCGIGWFLRSSLDRVIETIAIKVLTSVIGKEKVAEGLAKFLAEKAMRP